MAGEREQSADILPPQELGERAFKSIEELATILIETPAFTRQAAKKYFRFPIDMVGIRFHPKFDYVGDGGKYIYVAKFETFPPQQLTEVQQIEASGNNTRIALSIERFSRVDGQEKSDGALELSSEFRFRNRWDKAKFLNGSISVPDQKPNSENAFSAIHDFLKGFYISW